MSELTDSGHAGTGSAGAAVEAGPESGGSAAEVSATEAGESVPAGADFSTGDAAGSDRADRGGSGAQAETGAAAGMEGTELEPGESGPAEADWSGEGAERQGTADQAGDAGPEAGAGDFASGTDTPHAEPGGPDPTDQDQRPAAAGDHDRQPPESANTDAPAEQDESASGDVDSTGQNVDSMDPDSLGDLDDAAPSGAKPETELRIPYRLTESGGLNFLPGSDEAGEFAAKADGIPGYTDVVIHGNPYAFGLSENGPSLSPQEMADAIRSAPDYDGGPVRLVSCNSGELPGGAAQQVADALNQPVIAASDKIWPLPNGRLIIGPSPIRRTGEWRAFNPRKSAR